jgi:hypothetical protein
VKWKLKDGKKLFQNISRKDQDEIRFFVDWQIGM